MSVDILGTSWAKCRSMVQYSFTSTETRTDSPGRPPRLSHNSWTMKRWPAGDDDNVAGDLGHVLDAHVHQAAQNGLHHKQKNQTSKGRQCETVWTLLVKGAILWYRTTTVALKAKWAAPQRKEPGMKNCTAPNGLKSPCKKPKNPLYHLAPVALCRLSSPSFTPLTVQVPLLE